jgi:hypothetical protein
MEWQGILQNGKWREGIATQYGWHGVGNSTWLAWHCDVILPVEMCQWVWQT